MPTTSKTPKRILRPIAEAWRELSRLSLDPIQAGEDQRREMRRAFYAGAHAVLTELLGVAADDVPDFVGAALLAAMADETTEFYRRIQAGEPGV